MYTKSPSVDWYTGTTWDKSDARRIYLMALKHGGGSSEDSRIRQYRGQLFPKSFVGKSEEIPEHYMVRVWGDNSSDFHDELRLEDLKDTHCTRLDVQITIPIDWKYNARKLRDKIAKAEEERGGRGRNVPLIDQGGMDTIYVGSWNSEKFYRIYVKKAGEQKFLRFEVCFKKGYSEDAYRQSLKGVDALGAMLRAELATLPTRDLTVTKLRAYLKAYKERPVMRERKEHTDGRLTWLKRQVMPAIYKMIEDEEIGDFAGAMVLELYEYGREFGRIDKTR